MGVKKSVHSLLIIKNGKGKKQQNQDTENILNQKLYKMGRNTKKASELPWTDKTACLSTRGCGPVRRHEH